VGCDDRRYDNAQLRHGAATDPQIESQVNRNGAFSLPGTPEMPPSRDGTPGELLI
jgi:hypothetical protein